MSLILELMEHFGLGQVDLQRIIDTAPARYKVYEIPKRHGGNRVIAQPSRELKAIQRYVLDQKLSSAPVHHCAMAYAKERNIFSNASAHMNAGPILKLDFSDFFPSIKVRDWEIYAKANLAELLHLPDLRLYSKILFWGKFGKSTVPDCLSIGAPTSPALSNILLYSLDVTLWEAAMGLGVQYTRYADDITVSGATLDVVTEFERVVRKAVAKLRSPRLKFNDEKRGVYLRGQRRLVTGLVVTPMQTISIGRQRKRTISSLLHRSSLNQLDPKQRSYLKGMLGFCIANEPSFIGRLRTKYGDVAVNAALQFHAPSKVF